jgi:methylated-DNA-[protein]-cysteine S-methyltransferase
VACVRYEVDGWGVGELCVADRRVVWHELPRPVVSQAAGPRSPRGDSRPPTKTLPRDSSHLGEDFVPTLISRLRAYFVGGEDAFADVPLDLRELTPFERRCARALRRVGRGATVTYGELAEIAGSPRAARAAGSFCARNRFGVFIPCHRVVSAAGLGGYGSLGPEYKRRLLALERVAG